MQQRPENEKGRPGARAANSENDLLAGPITPDLTDSGALVVDVERAIAGRALGCSDLESARRLAEGLTADIFTDPVSAWAFSAALHCIEAGTLPTPLTAGIEAQHSGLLCPIVGRSSSVLSELEVNAPCRVNIEWLKLQLHGNRIRRAAEQAAHRLAEISWRGDLTELAQAWQQAAGTVIAELAAVCA
jgi:hypothetical protein